MENDAFKTPNEIKDYTIDWDQSSYCGGPVLQPTELIAVSVWSYTNVNGDTSLNIAADPSTITDGIATTVWLGGGTIGQVYNVTNTVMTNNSPPRTYERTFPCYVNAINSL